MIEATHEKLPCGIEYAVLPLPHRHVVTFQIRILSGTVVEPEDKLGLARLVEETIDKGTAQFSGRALSDAFDTIGAARTSGTGRETITLSCTVLPEHFEKAVSLYADFLRTATFPDDAFRVAVDLAQQELDALEDDAHSMADKLMGPHVFGPVLGRHPLGERDTLNQITRDDLLQYWQSYGCAGRMLVSVTGAVEPARVADVFERHFAGFGDSEPLGREPVPLAFTPGITHHDKQLEQEQIGIAWPGVDLTHDSFPTQQVLLGVLSGGMSGRLFTEVREKQGLVYWVSAWQDTPRGSGMLFLGASTTPERCEKTYTTLLREVDRLAADIEQDELDRAITGIVAGQETRGDSTRARCAELGGDLFFYGQPIPREEKLAKVQAVTVKDIRAYLDAHPRDELCVLTLGPKALQPNAPSMVASDSPAGDTA